MLPSNGKLKPLPFQKKSILRIEEFDGRTLVAMPMGSGKSLISLWCFSRNPDWLPALVICPASLKYNWEYETFRALGIRASVCEGRSPPKGNPLGFGNRPSITIINYDILKDWMSYLKRLGIKTVILDESQYCINLGTQRTKLVREICRRKPHVLALSGTPLVNRPLELFPALNILWNREFKYFHSYVQEFCDPKYTPWGWDYTGASNLTILRKKLLDLGMVRWRKEQILKELPKKSRRMVPCRLSDPREYDYASKSFLSWIKLNHGHKMRKVKKAESLVKIGYLLRLCAKLKLKSVVDQVNQSLEGNDEKIVLSAIHKKAIDVLHRRIKHPSIVVDGSVTGRKRQLCVDQFRKDPKIRVLIGQSQVIGVGWNLTEAATVGVVEYGWRPGDYSQVEDRIHRIGQTKKCIVNYYTAVGTIEEKLCRIIQEKQDVISAVLDGGRMPQDMNLFDLLLQELKEG